MLNIVSEMPRALAQSTLYIAELLDAEHEVETVRRNQLLARRLDAEQHHVKDVRRTLHFTRLLDAEDRVKGVRSTCTSRDL